MRRTVVLPLHLRFRYLVWNLVNDYPLKNGSQNFCQESRFVFRMRVGHPYRESSMVGPDPTDLDLPVSHRC